MVVPDHALRTRLTSRTHYAFGYFRKHRPRARIMLVEDSLLDARLTIEALRRCGIFHRLSLFRDGGEAMGFLNRQGVFARAQGPM